MKPFFKYAALGLAGYLVGFYEMRYKTTKALLNVMVEKYKKDSEDKKRGGVLMGSSSFIFSVGQQIQSFIFERRKSYEQRD